MTSKRSIFVRYGSMASNGVAGFKDKPAPHPAARIARKRLCDIVFRFRFDMNGDGIRAGFEEARQVMIGMLDHEMNVERKLRVLSHGRDDRRPKRNVIDEMAVHDVEMEPIGAGLFGAMDLGFELREIRGENGRSDEDFRVRHKERRRGNVQRPTSNVQRSIAEGNVRDECGEVVCLFSDEFRKALTLDVGCCGRWTFALSPAKAAAFP